MSGGRIVSGVRPPSDQHDHSNDSMKHANAQQGSAKESGDYGIKFWNKDEFTNIVLKHWCGCGVKYDGKPLYICTHIFGQTEDLDNYSSAVSKPSHLFALKWMFYLFNKEEM